MQEILTAKVRNSRSLGQRTWVGGVDYKIGNKHRWQTQGIHRTNRKDAASDANEILAEIQHLNRHTPSDAIYVPDSGANQTD